MGSRCDPVFAAGKVDSTSQPGNAWPGAWKVLETAPSMGACGSWPPWTGCSSLSSVDSCVFNMFTFFSDFSLYFAHRRPIRAYTYLTVLDHPGDQVIKARRFGRKAVLEITLHCNSRTGFFIEGHSWCQTHVEQKKQAHNSGRIPRARC